MSATLIIRPFQPVDRAACARIYAQARRVAFHWCPPEMFTESEFDRDSEGETIFVAESWDSMARNLLGWLQSR